MDRVPYIGGVSSQGGISPVSNRAAGKRGEELAGLYLSERGYKILFRNYRGSRGEIDLIVMHGGTLLFVEVKYRRDLDQGHPAEAITPRKLAHFRSAVTEFLLSGEAPPFTSLKFDAVCIIELPGQPPVIELFEHILGP